MIVVWGYVNGLEKYENMIWKVCMSLFRIDDGSVWWLWKRGGYGWFVFWKWFDVSIGEEDNFHSKILYRWEEGVVFDGCIE